MLKNWPVNITLNTDNQHIPLYQQLANEIKKLITTGILKNGDMLPSSRELSEELGISRKTVITAMEQLTFRGILQNRERVGIFVATRKTAQDLTIASQHPTPNTPGQPNLLEVDDGCPDTQFLPIKEFTRGFRQFFTRAAQWKMMGYRDPQGYERFRQSVSLILSHGRGLPFSQDEIFITRGSQMALYLVANAILHRGDTIVMENPGYPMARGIFLRAGLNVVQVNVDSEGINTERLTQICSEQKVRAMYLTPRYQYPTTVQLTASRRKQIAALVEKYDILVLEDDFGCDFIYTGKIPPTLSSLLPKKNRVYIGTFSKIFSPSLRLGYIATSSEYMQSLAELRTLIDIQGDNVAERTMMEMIDSGELLKHVRKTSKIYKEKLAYLNDRIRITLAGKVIYRKPVGGLAVWMLLKTSKTEADIRSQLREKSIQLPLFTTSSGKVGVRMGFASLSFPQIDFVISSLESLNL